MKKSIFFYSVLFLFFLIFFLYCLFPYKILKDVVLSEVQTQMRQNDFDLNLSVKSISPYWFTGVKIEGLKIENKKFLVQTPIVLNQLTARVSLLPLLLGNVKVDLQLVQSHGSANISASFALLPLFLGHIKPNAFEAQFHTLALDGLVSQALGLLKASRRTNMALVLPVISNTKAGGSLNGEAWFYSATSTSSAEIKLHIQNGYLNVNNGSLNIPPQNFSKANVNISWNGTVFEVKEETRFEAQNITIHPTGQIKLGDAAKNLPAQIDLRMMIAMSGEVEKNFSFVLPKVLNCSPSSMSGGTMNARLVGAFDNFICE